MNGIQTVKRLSISAFRRRKPGASVSGRCRLFRNLEVNGFCYFPRMLIAFSTSSASCASRSSCFKRAISFLLIRGQRHNYRSREQGYLLTRKSFQPFRQSAVTYTEILGTPTNIQLLYDQDSTGPQSSLNCLSYCFDIMRSSFKTMLLLYHLLLIRNSLILTLYYFLL